MIKGKNDLSKLGQPAIDVRTNFIPVVDLMIRVPIPIYREKVMVESNVSMKGEIIFLCSDRLYPDKIAVGRTIIVCSVAN